NLEYPTLKFPRAKKRTEQTFLRNSIVRPKIGRSAYNQILRGGKGKGDKENGLYDDEIEKIMSQFKDWKGCIMRDEIKNYYHTSSLNLDWLLLSIWILVPNLEGTGVQST